MDAETTINSQQTACSLQPRFWTEDYIFIGMQEQTVSSESVENSAFFACSKLFESFTEAASMRCEVEPKTKVHRSDDWHE